MDQSRRKFLLSGWKVGGAVLVGAAVYTAYEALRPLAGGAGGTKLKVGPPDNFAKGTSTYFPEGRMYVVNAKGDLLALSQKCPHLGCKVPFCESSGRFECPCHGSIFDIGGEYITGPSPRWPFAFVLLSLCRPRSDALSVVEGTIAFQHRGLAD